MTDHATGGLLQIRSITNTALLVDFAIGHGLSLESALRHTGIHERMLMSPDGYVTQDQEIAVMRNIIRHVGDEPGLGLLAGVMCQPPLLGALACAIMSQSTVRRALEVGLRYADLSCSFARYSVEQHDDEIWLVRDDSTVPEDLRRFSLEHDLGALACIQREMLPSRWRTKRVEVTVAAHPIYDGFAMVLGVPELICDAPRTLIVFGAELLNLPMPQASPITARRYESQCAAMLQRRLDQNGVSGQARGPVIRGARRLALVTGV
ncbi:AraC family transcriptional regulator [Nocardia sp. CDC160]|uniref:AraC family transcriptional regulator n=1 Tax=Nocardia sp. CDC160 TaxID=3112166 RepID=UPI002DB9ABA0|nr:AraC family transcriptional regulator [Nocardia sp. CDC160]MEC3918382.1 AraC family transcriptional regulator [Nocardia sp. CDC160]